MTLGKHSRVWTLLGVVVLVGALLLSGCATPAATPTTDPAPGATTAPAAPAATTAPATDPTAGGPAATGADASSEAAKRGYILVGVPLPQTGPLAPFGETTPWIEQKITDEINKDGGIMIKDLGKKLPVKFKVVDTESNPTKASEVTNQLILNDKVDALVTVGTPDTGNPVSASAERYKVPCVVTNCPVEPWLKGGPYKYAFIQFFTINQVSDAYMAYWNAFETNKKVGILLDNSADGMAWAQIFNTNLPKVGYTVVDPGRWPTGTKDFTTIINKFKAEGVEILAGSVIAPDFAQFWRQSKQLGFTPKLATVGKGLVFASDVYGLGDELPLGLSSEAYWTKDYTYDSTIGGWSPADLAKAYTDGTKKQWHNTLGPKNAAWEILIDAYKRAQTVDKDKVAAAIAETSITSMLGPVKFDQDHVSPVPVVIVQWQHTDEWDWDEVIVSNDKYTDLPKQSAEPIFPLPQ